MAAIRPNSGHVSETAPSNLSYNPAPVLFRKAMAAAKRARSTASGHVQWTANPRAREADDTIIAIVLAHAAVETAWHWEQLLVGRPARRWPGEFLEGLITVCEARGRPDPPQIDPALRDGAVELNAWRNVLLHGDEESRSRLTTRLGHPVEPSQLNADLAELAVMIAKRLGDYMASATGTQRLFDTNWIDPLEI